MTRRSPGVIGTGFWQRLVGRYRRRTAVRRPRAALVLRRSHAAGPAERVVRLREPSGPALALHVHLAWPGWLYPVAAPAVAPAVVPAVAAAPAAGRAARSAGRTARVAAPVHRAAMRITSGPAAVSVRPAAREWSAPARAYPRPGEARGRGPAAVSLQPALAPVHRVLPATHAAGDGRPRIATHPRYGDRALPLAQATIGGRSAATAAARHRPSLITVDAAEAVLASARETSPARVLQAHDVIRRVWRQPEVGVTESPPSRSVRAARRAAPEVALRSTPEDARSSALRLVQRRHEAFAASDTPRPSFPSGGRFFLPAPRTLAQTVPAAAASPPAPAVTAASPAPAAYASDGRSVPPQLDLARLSEEVYRQIERRARSERERRGR